MKPFVPLRLLSFVVLSFFLFSACDSGGSNDATELNNEFSLTISPSSQSNSGVPSSKDAPEELNGVSFFVDTENIEEVQEQSFAIYLSGGETSSQSNIAQGLFGFLGRQSTRPEEGTYTLADLQGTSSATNFIGAVYEDVQNISSAQGAPIYFIKGGTLDLQESNDNEVSGTLTATATEYTFTTNDSEVGFEVVKESVDITGNFTAKNLNAYVPFDQYTAPPSQ